MDSFWRIFWVIFVVGLAAACDGESQQKLEKCTAELAAAEYEVTSVRAELKRVSGELARLKATDTGLWRRIQNRAELGLFDDALQLLAELEKNHPSSPLIEKVSAERIKLKKLSTNATIDDLEAKMPQLGKSYCEEALARLDGILSEKHDATTLRRAKKLRSAFAEKIENWPVKMTVKELKLRIHDMVGKRIRMFGKLVPQDSYNFGYSDRNRFYSFELKTGTGALGEITVDWNLDVYCYKNEPKCKKLFEAQIKNSADNFDATIEISKRHYMQGDTSSALLVEWVRR